jgi:hypothetical protein
MKRKMIRQNGQLERIGILKYRKERSVQFSWNRQKEKQEIRQGALKIQYN